MAQGASHTVLRHSLLLLRPPRAGAAGDFLKTYDMTVEVSVTGEVRSADRLRLERIYMGAKKRGRDDIAAGRRFI
jgi:hypothetical protein